MNSDSPQLCRLRSIQSVLILAWLGSLALSSVSAQPARLKLEPEDHICIIGNTLADRMQHDGWLETEINLRHPDHRLVIRNLGFSADTLNTRLRSANFGSPDRHLKENQADVILMMFGYNESFAGESGLESFKKELAAQVEHMRSQKYNSQGPPRIAIVSPIAHEDLRTPNLPDGSQNNARLKLYTDAMRQVASELGCPFVDLFAPSQQLYGSHDQPLTLNGIHLNEFGNQLVARTIADGLFGDSGSTQSVDQVAAVRKAVQEKNFYWYNYYRITDGYSVFGGRSALKFVDGQTNRDVMKREQEILVRMTDNRDPAIWAALAGKDYIVDDDNTPPFVPVITNKPGTGPNGEHVYLSGEKAIERMKVLDGFEVNLFADESMFPELINPVQMAFDTRGRLWVATWPSYPHWKPKSKMDDRLLILEDTDGDGRADECKTFAGGLHNPTGFEFWGNGVLVARGPEILFLEDTDGDDVCDKRTIYIHGIDTADTHHTANSFTLGPGGAIYFQEGVFHHTQVETPYGPPIRNINAAVFRFDPRQHHLSVYTPYQYANPHGHVFDRWGQDIIHDGTGAVPYHGALISGHLDFPNKHRSPPKVYERRTRPCPATEIVSSEHFPEAMQDDLLVQNVIGDLGILRYRISDDLSSLKGVELEPLLLSDDQNFRPVDMEFGPRGELFFTDWQNPVIGHMQHNLRDPSRDQKHGRVYRLVSTRAPLAERERVAQAPLPELLDNLKLPTNRTRYRTRIELSGRDTAAVIEATREWVAGLNKQHPDYEHHLLEALWVCQQHNVVDAELLTRVLASPDFRARAAATRVLCYWRDKVSDSASRLLKCAGDEHPRVRLESVRAASFLAPRYGIPIVLQALAFPTDKYLDYLVQETMRAYSQPWTATVIENNLLQGQSQAAVDFILRQVSDTEVQRFPMDEQVATHLLYRTGIGEKTRGDAISKLAELTGRSRLAVTLETLEAIDPEKADGNVVFELVRLMAGSDPDELKTVRDRLETMARTGKLPLLRQIGYVGMITADQTHTAVWDKANALPEDQKFRAVRDLVSALGQIPDPGLQARMYPAVVELTSSLANSVNEDAHHQTKGRYIRIELPGNQRTLTLAEVEVFSDGTNIAGQGKASQLNTAHNGDPQRAVDGNKSAAYSDAGQTHTRENSRNPWWELDLGRLVPLEKISVYNRGENFAQRLDGFTLKILDNNRDVIFEQRNIPAPQGSSEFQVGQQSVAHQLLRACIKAMPYVRGQEPETFNILSAFILNNTERDEAIRSMLRVPTQFWNQGQAQPLVDAVMPTIREMPAAARTSATAADRTQLVEALLVMIPGDAASPIRAELAELGVRIIRIGTRPHRMAYDKELIVVKAGKPIEIIFENTDMMPHNLVFVKPGSMQEIGEAAEVMAQQKSAIERHYVPRSAKVLASSKLIQPGDQQRLQFNVPAKPGIYPYVCTYPGHWRRMFGSLVVVRDPAQYAAQPDQYMADNGLEIKDELLKLNMRTRTEWKVSDFDSAFDTDGEYFTGRDFAQGKQMFQISSCISCHKMQGEGYEIGPDLTTKLDPKWTAKDVLREIVEPSIKIDDEFKQQIFALESGETISGIVTFEDDDVVKIVENPLVASDPKVIEKFEIEDQKKSDVSVMPKGLLDTLTREEILDLVAYIMAKGEKDHKLFQGHDH